MRKVKGIISDIKNVCARDAKKKEVTISTKEELNAMLTICIETDVFVKVYCEELKENIGRINVENVTNVLMRQSGESGIALRDLVKGYGLQRLPVLWHKFVETANELDKLLKTLLVFSEEGASKVTNGGSITTEGESDRNA